MGRITDPRPTQRIDPRERVVGFAETDGLSEDEIERSLRASDVVNQALGITPKVEIPIGLSSGVRELDSNMPAYRCDQCGHVFGLDRMIKYRGKYYCTVHECAEERLVGLELPRGAETWPPFDFWNKFAILKTEEGNELKTEEDFNLYVERF
jgi:hypothetical protein